jgi:hypothetical protein
MNLGEHTLTGLLPPAVNTDGALPPRESGGGSRSWRPGEKEVAVDAAMPRGRDSVALPGASKMKAGRRMPGLAESPVCRGRGGGKGWAGAAAPCRCSSCRCAARHFSATQGAMVAAAARRQACFLNRWSRRSSPSNCSSKREKKRGAAFEGAVVL